MNDFKLYLVNKNKTNEEEIATRIQVHSKIDYATTQFCVHRLINQLITLMHCMYAYSFPSAIHYLMST